MHTAAASLALLLALGFAGGCGGDDEEAGSFVGIPWVVSSGIDLGGGDAVPSATFTNDTVGGSTGCNRFTASYTVDGDSMEIGKIASTRMACPPPADAVERAYLAALGRVAWHKDGSKLVLADAEHNEVLRYEEASPLGDWEVTAFLSGDAVTSPLPGTTITARFADDGTLTGSSGCNTYQTAFTLGRGSIEIEPPAATQMACAEPEGVMNQEAAYLAALPTAVGYRVDGGSLALVSADGTYVASYTRAAQP
jgi:heat shock protein HslJ